MSIKSLIFDLDGTVYRGSKAIPGAVQFIKGLTIPYLFVTNRANRTPGTVVSQLNEMGIQCDESNVLTSAQAVAWFLGNQQRVYCIGEEGLYHALKEMGSTVIGHDENTPDTVIVSYDREFSYEKLTQAMRYIIDGARFVATNDDRIITTEIGLVPEAGPLVAAVSEATGVKPKIVGKPHTPIMELALQRMGVTAEETAIVGDNLLTDILAGQNAGMASALILTGVSSAQDVEESDIKPTWIVANYAELALALNL